MISNSSFATDFENNLELKNLKCAVCDYPARGYHFGAFTCEGCKSFFGRTCKPESLLHLLKTSPIEENLKNCIESIPLKCKNNYNCNVKGKNRTSCKACRYKACLKVGMAPQNSRYGRRSRYFKISAVLDAKAQIKESFIMKQNFCLKYKNNYDNEKEGNNFNKLNIHSKERIFNFDSSQTTMLNEKEKEVVVGGDNKLLYNFNQRNPLNNLYFNHLLGCYDNVFSKDGSSFLQALPPYISSEISKNNNTKMNEHFSDKGIDIEKKRKKFSLFSISNILHKY